MKKSVTKPPAPSTIRNSRIDNRAGEIELILKAEAYFDRYGRPGRGGRILVAVSGGPDSVALLSVFVELSKKHTWKIGVAHVNHGLRGAESIGDCEFVCELAASLGLPFYSRTLNPQAARKERNLQAWARTARYKFLESTARRHKYSHIAVAHQLDDRAETIAAAVLDAAGTFALSGIPPVRGMIIRPLFDVSRSEIMTFLSSRQISYRLDSSNESDKYQRNRVRHTVLPLWKTENPGIAEGLARLGEQLWLQRRYLEDQARRIVERSMVSTTVSGVTLRVDPLMRADRALDPYILRELVARIGLDLVPRASTVMRFSELRNWTESQGAFSIEQGKFAALLSQGVVRVYKKRSRTAAANLDVAGLPMPTLETRILEATRHQQFDDKVMARFDLDAVEGEVSVRWPRPGDRYQPIGLRGTKKLSDLLADRKVPSFERPLVPLVVDTRGILWPVGHPIAHRARLTHRTRRVMEARLQEGSWKNRS